MSTPIIDDTLRRQIADDLAGQFKGDIIGPDHAEYEEARQVWNAMIDRQPGLILRCTSTADVVAAVNVAREHGLPPSVRCGGHNVAGKGMSEGGLTIDLSGLREVTVDPGRQLVHAGGGCLLGTVDAATAPHALVVPAGIMSETGVAGLALGGGIGWFSRKHGLTCDQFVVPGARAGQRRGDRGLRGLPPGAVLGAAGRRRQLRHRHPLHVRRARLRADDADRGVPVRRGARGRGAARVRGAGADAAASRRLARGAQARHARAALRAAGTGRPAGGDAVLDVAGRRRGPGWRGDDRPPVRRGRVAWSRPRP